MPAPVSATTERAPRTSFAKRSTSDGGVARERTVPLSTRPLLSPAEARRPFAEKRRDALLRVPARKHGSERALLRLDPLVQLARAGDALDLLHRDRRLTGQLARPRERGVQQLVILDHAIDETELERFLGENRVADEVHLQGLVRPHQPRQPLGAAEARDDPQLDLRLAEDRRARRDPHVARHRELAAATERQAVDRGDRGDALGAELFEQRVRGVDQLLAAGRVHRRERLDVGARAVQERVRRGDHERPHRGLRRLLDPLPHLAQVLDHLRGDRVHLTVREPRDRHAVGARLELDDLGRLLRVGLRIGVEALPALLSQPALGDQAAQDRRRGEPLAVALLRVLHPLEHLVEPFDVRLHERRQEAAPRVEAGAGHHPEVDVAMSGHALLEHQARLEQRLQRQQLDQLLDIRCRIPRDVRLALRIVEPVAAALRAELAVGDQLLHALRHVEPFLAV